MGLKDEVKILLGLSILLGFLVVNVETSLGSIFTVFLVMYALTIVSPSIPKIQIWRNETPMSFLKSLFIGAVVFGAWLGLTYFVLSGLNFTTIPFSVKSVLEAISQDVRIPVLSNNPFVVFTVYGFSIPVFESLLFLGVGIVFWELWTKSKALGKPFSPRGFYIMALIGAVASLFHLYVRMTTGSLSGINSAMIADFLFFSMSAFLVLKYSHLLEAIFFHIFVNTGYLWSRGSI